MRRGSALLIVIGMLSFMLFSGLAFSVYMRQTRLPSSFIRRTAVTRQLAKSALSEAMCEINSCIGNDPHPGIPGPTKPDGCDFNTWYRRVFLGVGINKGKTDPDDRKRTLREDSDSYGSGYLKNNVSDDPDETTVPTLSLEGLTYLPPSLVNEARVYSRRTPTAQWTPFAFEAGRFAFTAIDVSDYFDVNRVPVDIHRSSASSSRITLAHVFEEAAASRMNNSDVKDYPFVSLADWNLYMGNTPLVDGKPSPVMAYLIGKGDDPCHVAGDETEKDENVMTYSQMTFVTDSKFVDPSPSDGGAVKIEDIEEEENQPFDTEYLRDGGGRSLDQFLAESGAMYGDRKSVWEGHYLNFLSRLGMCMLYDYLDEDSVPVSLVIPSCEQVPMICAFRPQVSEMTFKIRKLGDPTKADELLNAAGTGPADNPAAGVNERTVSCWFSYQLDVNGGGGKRNPSAQVDVMTLYPFRRNYRGEEESFDVDGQLAMYFTKTGEDIPLVAGSQRKETNLFMDKTVTYSFNDSDGFMKCPIEQKTIEVPKGIVQESDVKWPKGTDLLRATEFSKFNENFKMNEKASDKPSRACLAKVRYQWKQMNTAAPGSPPVWTPSWPDTSKDPIVETAEVTFPYLDQDGAAQKVTKDMCEKGASLELNLAVWLRVRADGTDTVDMVPARGRDDSVQGVTAGGGRSSGGRDLGAAVYQRMKADGLRLMQFKFKADGSSALFNLSYAKMDSEPEITLSLDAGSMVCIDPRYNHHPRNWFRGNGDSARTAWESESSSSWKYEKDCQFVSNQGYLQSIYELAFLPRNTEPTKDGDRGGDEMFGTLDCSWNEGWGANFPSSAGECLNHKDMWKSYRLYGDDADYFENLRLTSGKSGLKVNPFSDSTAVLSAVFANTPVDWRAASTNFDGEASIGNAYKLENVDAFNQKYTWCEDNGEAKLTLDGESSLARAFMGKMRNCRDIYDWESVYNELWDRGSSGSSMIMGAEINGCEFNDVDKKFLYGYWHDCFGVQQQLFLIFVRAEPMMMGGGVAGAAPPVMASRAVALVWRDPRPTELDSGGRPKPHAMRVLFYHQLD